MQELEIDTKSYFYFKKFTVKQDLCPLRVGTDAVLLGAWANFEGAKSILDVGTGTGVIALMLAQRHEAYIKGIDINPLAAKQSMDNFKNNLWASRMHSRHISVQDLSYTGQKYDGIICNPPFFAGSLHSPDTRKTEAKHSDLVLPLDELFLSAVNLLTENGSLAIILPAELYDKAIYLANQQSLFPSKVLWVRTLADKPPKRVLIHLYRKKHTPINESIISIEHLPEGRFLPEYEKLVEDYFLNKQERQILFGLKKARF